MKILPYTQENKASILAEALVVLLSGGTIVYPTETAYGLGADFFSPKAYRSIFSIKNRHAGKALPVIVPDMRYATTLVEFEPPASKLAAQYWPGPLTLVLPFRYSRQYEYHADPYLALRVSSNHFAASLSQAFGKPLIATSANTSGKAATYSVDEIIRQFEKSRMQPDLIIDAGELPKVMPSTIVKVDRNGVEVIREGAIQLKTF